MNDQLIRRIVERCKYPGFTFLIDNKDSVLFLQIQCDDKCNVTGEPIQWKSRKWMLSQHMVKSEIVQTVFLAIRTAIEHEMREKFKYNGYAIFGPHFDVDRLMGLAADIEGMDTRP